MNGAWRARVAYLAILITSPAIAASPGSGATLYEQHCSVCHQQGGVGVPGAFPRLAGRVGKLVTVPAGRKVVVLAVLHGMAGKLTVDGEGLIGVMTPFPQLTDAQIATVLNYVAQLGHLSPKPLTVTEVAAVRSLGAMSASQVNALARNPELARIAP